MGDDQGPGLPRRKLLGLLGIGAVGLAGCSGGDNSGNEETEEQNSPTTTPTVARQNDTTSGGGPQDPDSTDSTPDDTPTDTETRSDPDQNQGTPDESDEDDPVDNSTGEENGTDNRTVEDYDPTLMLEGEELTGGEELSLNPGNTLPFRVGNVESADMYLETADGEIIYLEEGLSDGEFGDSEFLDVEAVYNEIIENVDPGTYPLTLQEDEEEINLSLELEAQGNHRKIYEALGFLPEEEIIWFIDTEMLEEQAPEQINLETWQWRPSSEPLNGSSESPEIYEPDNIKYVCRGKTIDVPLIALTKYDETVDMEPLVSVLEEEETAGGWEKNEVADGYIFEADHGTAYIDLERNLFVFSQSHGFSETHETEEVIRGERESAREAKDWSIEGSPLEGEDTVALADGDSEDLPTLPGYGYGRGALIGDVDPMHVYVRDGDSVRDIVYNTENWEEEASGTRSFEEIAGIFNDWYDWTSN